MTIRPERIELLRLRSRVVVLEKAAMAALELVLRIRPEELSAALLIARRRLAESYEDPAFSPDLIDEEERAFMAAEVESHLQGLQHELGFSGGKFEPEQG